MDEPFSAADPVVREGLQDELLRLQSELGKTILFVTHDIDEAVKLGDQVAVFRQGGKLVQFAPPAELLERPADDFVASFVGRDRGYRRLSFVDAQNLTIHQLDTVDAPAAKDGARPDGWRLVVDERRRPGGWLPPGSGEVMPGGSLHPHGGSLRSALDAALSSPSGLGVVVDDDGAVVGGVRAEEVLELIQANRQLQGSNQ